MPRIVLPVNDCIYVLSCAFCYPFAFSIHFTAFASLFPESAKCPPGFISYITSLSFLRSSQISFVRSATVAISLSDVRDSLPPRLMYIRLFASVGWLFTYSTNPGYHIEPEHVAHPANISVWYIAQSAKSPASEYPMI